MKKVKMFVTAIAIFAVVGSALAFKTNKANTGGTLLCNLNAIEAAPCASTTIKYLESSLPGNQPAYCNDGAGSPTCDQPKPHIIQNDK